jgi:hypothetical protein
MTSQLYIVLNTPVQKKLSQLVHKLNKQYTNTWFCDVRCTYLCCTTINVFALSRKLTGKFHSIKINRIFHPRYLPSQSRRIIVNLVGLLTFGCLTTLTRSCLSVVVLKKMGIWAAYLHCKANINVPITDI